jgi:pimeloyl-ACP methyl ester carboxylesterase
VRARIFSLCLAFCIGTTVASPEDFPRGRVISRVECAGDPGQSYALYLPTHYDALKKWPAIYAFDPMGQGSRPAELLQPAAEKYGYLVVASNNSRNGPLAVSVEAMQALWTDSRLRFSIDEQRIYAVGFSGGARMAMLFGLSLPGHVQGVIPAGAGLPLGIEVKPPPSLAVYAIVGIRDFNYGEMKDLDRRWAEWGAPHRLEVTEGEHRWPSHEVFTRAIEWMELQGIKSRILAPNPDRLGALLEARLGRARELEKAGRTAQAYRECEFTLGDFRGLRDTSEVEAFMSGMRKSADIKKLLKKEQKREENREQLDALFTSQLATVQEYIADPATNPAALRESIRALDIHSLRRDMKSGKNEDRSIVADRQVQRILVAGWEDANSYFQRKEPARALASLELAALVRPESPEVQFLFARALALEDQKREALKALAKAAELGFSSCERIEREPAFAPLRQDPQYADTLAKIRARAQSGHH